MRLKQVRAHNFRRFSDLEIQIPSREARLIVLAGPNGNGKSSLIDALMRWQGRVAGMYPHDPSFFEKAGAANGVISIPDQEVEVQLHDLDPQYLDDTSRKHLVYVRTAHRNETDVVMGMYPMMNGQQEQFRSIRSVDTDLVMQQRSQFLVNLAINAVFSNDSNERLESKAMVDKFLDPLRESLERVLPHLALVRVNDPSSGSMFMFSKDGGPQYPYVALSAGEKAVFDILFDVVISRGKYANALWCIDEPEIHLNNSVQAKLLEELLALLPEECQLLIATHSVGFISYATQLARQTANSVVFLDFNGKDFDETVRMEPVAPSREFWQESLSVAVGEIAELVAPKTLVLCEGGSPAGVENFESGFDASCYTEIFRSKYADVEFISVGSKTDVESNKLGLLVKKFSPATTIIRLRDRDALSDQELQRSRASGVRPLTRICIEDYLLDDELLSSIEGEYRIGTGQLAAARDEKLGTGKTGANLKAALRAVHLQFRNLTGVQQEKSTSFAIEILAPKLSQVPTVFCQLERDVFGELEIPNGS